MTATSTITPTYTNTPHQPYPEFDQDFASLTTRDLDHLITIIRQRPTAKMFREMRQMAAVTLPLLRLLSHLYITAHSLDGFPTLYYPGDGYSEEAIMQMRESAVDRLS